MTQEPQQKTQEQKTNICTRTERACMGGAFDGEDGWGIDCPSGDRQTCGHLSDNKSEFDLYYDRYFDDIEGHIEMLNIELETTEGESEHADDLKERIEYLKERMTAGDAYVDNDTTASPDAWKTLATYTEAEARAQYQRWN